MALRGDLVAVKLAAMPDIHLRPFIPSDSSALARLWYASWLSTGVPAANKVTQEDLLERVAAESALGWSVTVAEIGDELVGFLTLKPEEYRLDQLFVAPEHKGSGIGARLFALAEEAMPGGFALRTASTNVQARRFYEKHGMRLDRLEPHPVHGYEVAIYVTP
jgi:putative acetyltransferase